MAVKQLSVFVENKPGKLMETVNLISGAGVNIRAMSIADTKDFGILRLIVSDLEKAKVALSEDHLLVVTDVIAVEMRDQTGSLADILEILGRASVNIEYMYAFTAPTAHGAYVVLRVDDTESAEQVLKRGGISMLTESDIPSI